MGKGVWTIFILQILLEGFHTELNADFPFIINVILSPSLVFPALIVVVSPVTLEQCRHETAMLLFTVMDYDVLTTNDFAGEALLSLNTIPGVATAAHGLDNTFHGLKQIDLFLMHQSNKRTILLSCSSAQPRRL